MGLRRFLCPGCVGPIQTPRVPVGRLRNRGGDPIVHGFRVLAGANLRAWAHCRKESQMTRGRRRDGWWGWGAGIWAG
ncbi:MAG: hypothetical protein ACK559_37885, partial [bacterium]